jgi:hypothetical protein
VYPPDATAEDRRWLNDAHDNALLAPQNRQRMRFWQWYGRWLEDALRGIAD